jgi:diaminopimelate decarboxylase
LEFALHAGIGQFNVESEAELELLNELAIAHGIHAPVALRLNPDVDARTHAKISTGTAETKFGIPWTRAREVYARAATLAGIRIAGVDVHIGSQISELAPFEQAFAKLAELIATLRADGHAIARADLGGGIGVPYNTSAHTPDLKAYSEIVAKFAREARVTLVLEPGRIIAASAGILVCRVIYIKEGEARCFAILDAGMNDLLRPALYGAHHEIVCVAPRENAPLETYDVVGPVCETSDIFGKNYRLPQLCAGDLVAVLMAGAYGAAMASAYNARTPAAEVLVKGAQWCVVRPKMSDDEFLGLDRVPAWIE